MASAQTLTDIVNLALASLGEKQITNIDSDGKTENLMRPLMYEAVRQTQLEIFWQELIIGFSPTQSSETYGGQESGDTTYIGSTYLVYNLPKNFLDVVRLRSGAYWFLEGNKLITTDPDPYLTYKRYSEEPSEWSAYLVELVYKRLAMNASMPVTQNANIQQQSVQLYNMAKNENLLRSANRQRQYCATPSKFSWVGRRSRRFGSY